MSFLRIVTFSLITTGLITLYLYPNYLRSVYRVGSASFVSAGGPSFGLKISLILASFYTAQGFSGLLGNNSDYKSGKRGKTATSSLIKRIPFHFMEIPLLLGLIVFGSAVLPDAFVQKYTKVLAGFSPVLPVLEVGALVTVVMTAGRTWTPQIIESHDFIKLSIILACFASFTASSSVFYFIYRHFHLSTLISSLLSSIFTLLCVQIITCCQLDHATITDPALIFPYISYNLILIVLKSGTRALLNHERDPQISPKDPQLFLKAVEFLYSKSLLTGQPPTLTRQIVQTIFSPVLIFHILIQLALLSFDSSHTELEEDEGALEGESFLSKIALNLTKLRSFFVTSLWPLFGKSFLVIIYTISWLEQCHPGTLETALNPTEKNLFLDSTGFWRWVAVFLALAAYGKHLIFDGQDKYSDNNYKCDKAFWRQFHNLKEE